MDSSLRGRPHLCFLHRPAFLCAVPRMGKAHSPNFSAEKLLPSGTSQAKFSPPVCSVGKQMSGFAPATSGSRVPSSSVLTTDNMGVQRGANMTPFAGNPKTRRFLARLSSISSRQEMDPGVQGREATLQKRSCRDYPAITFLRGRLPKDGEPLTAASPSFRRPR